MPDPPDKVTCALPLQSVNVTDVGLAENGRPGVGHAPAPLPVAFTVSGVEDVPSEIVTMAEVNAGDGFARRTETTLPLTLAVTLPLFEAAL